MARCIFLKILILQNDGNDRYIDELIEYFLI